MFLQFSGMKKWRCYLQLRTAAMSLVLLIFLQACEPAKKVLDPVSACTAVVSVLMNFALQDDVSVTEQEIRGERIVVHLAFKHPEMQEPVTSVCVFPIDRYQQNTTEGNQYTSVPGKLAINQQQISEDALLNAISRAGLE